MTLPKKTPVRAGLGAHRDDNVLELGGGFLGLSALARFLRLPRLFLEREGVEIVLIRFYGETAGEKVVAAVALGDFLHLAFFALSADILLENNFHGI